MKTQRSDNRAAGQIGTRGRDRSIVAERAHRVRDMLRWHGLYPIGARRTLEIGCGTGGVLAGLCDLGASPGQLYGVDIDLARVREARSRYPFLHVSCGDGEHLQFPDASFDIAVCFTLFSSLLARQSRTAVAGEIRRVLAPGGALLWYDMRVGSPRNSRVRGVPRGEIEELFEECRVDLRSVTLVPPLARWIDGFLPPLNAVLMKVPVLRTHYLGVITTHARRV